MIKNLLLASLLLSTMVLHAQNFELVKVNTHVSFLDSVNAFSQFVRPIKVIQNSIVGNLEVFDIEYDAGNCNIPTSIFGTKVEKTLTNNYLLYNSNLDTIIVNAFGNLNDFWKSYKYQDGSYIEAKITDISSKSFLGVTDMCKTITFTKKDQNDMDVLHPINGLEIIISQNYGLIKTVDFLNFPENVTAASLYLYGDIVLNPSKLNITTEEIYDFQIGDIFHYHTSSQGPMFPCTVHQEIVSQDSIMQKVVSQNLDTISYTILRKYSALYEVVGNELDGCGELSYSFYHDTIIKKVIFSSLNSLNVEPMGVTNNVIQYFNRTNNKLYKSLSIYSGALSDGCLYLDPCVENSYYSDEKYQKNLGRVSKQYDIYDDCQAHGFSYHDELVYTSDVSDEYDSPVDICATLNSNVVINLTQSGNSVSVENFISGDIKYHWYIDNTLILETFDNYFEPTQSGNVIAYITIDNCWWTTSELDFTYTAGIDELERNSITMYPNPSNDILNFQIKDGLNAEYEIFDISGKLISKRNSLTSLIDVGYLEKGTYLIKIYSSNQILSKSFVKIGQ